MDIYLFNLFMSQGEKLSRVWRKLQTGALLFVLFTKCCSCFEI